MSASAVAVSLRSVVTPAFEGIPWKDLSDEEVVSAFREDFHCGDREAAADELFRRHQPRIIRWCCRFTRDREAAFDLSQEILLRAYRNIEAYRGECRFSTWLYVIARNQCMSALQKRASEPAWVGKSTALVLPDTSADVHSAFEFNKHRNHQ